MTTAFPEACLCKCGEVAESIHLGGGGGDAMSAVSGPDSKLSQGSAFYVAPSSRYRPGRWTDNQWWGGFYLTLGDRA